MPYTLKARKHYGAKSLNLTIPTEIVEKYNLKNGDIFEIIIDDSINLKITYKLVYKIK